MRPRLRAAGPRSRRRRGPGTGRGRARRRNRHRGRRRRRGPTTRTRLARRGGPVGHDARARPCEHTRDRGRGRVPRSPLSRARVRCRARQPGDLPPRSVRARARRHGTGPAPRRTVGRHRVGLARRRPDRRPPVDSAVVSDADRLVALLEAKLRPLETALAEAWWETSTHASPEAAARRERVELERRELLGDPDAFGAIEAARRRADQFEPLLARQLAVLHDAFAPHQIDADLRRRIVELEVAVEDTFNTFRGEIDGRRVDDNAIADVLRTSEDTVERRHAWEAAKQVGAEVADRVRELARLRNEAARRLGYRDHFALALATGELDGDRLFATLDEVDRVSIDPFKEWKARLDVVLAERFGCDPGDLRPWHLDDPFFQDPPIRGAVDLDPLFSDADIEALTVRSYDGLGLDMRPVLDRSDLYAREGKSQHAFCIHVDREGDVRVLCNIERNERWTETMLHEFGHAA